MNKKQIARKLYEWYHIDKDTCSGKPHCDVEKCDICFTCFNELCEKFGLKYENGKVTVKEVRQT